LNLNPTTLRIFCIAVYIVFMVILSPGVSFTQDTVPVPTYSDINETVKNVEENISKTIGSKAPNLKFVNIETKTTQSLTDYLGKTILLKFWNRGCKPCEVEMHDISQLQKDYSERGLVVIYVCNLTAEDADRFFEARKMDGNTIEGIKAAVDDDSLIPPYQCLVAPMSIIIDPQGYIRNSWLKQSSYQKFEESILPFLTKAPKSCMLGIILAVVGVTALIVVFLKKVF
jgi:peroxiredoxin